MDLSTAKNAAASPESKVKHLHMLLESVEARDVSERTESDATLATQETCEKQ